MQMYERRYRLGSLAADIFIVVYCTFALCVREKENRACVCENSEKETQSRKIREKTRIFPPSPASTIPRFFLPSVKKFRRCKYGCCGSTEQTGLSIFQDMHVHSERGAVCVLQKGFHDRGRPALRQQRGKRGNKCISGKGGALRGSSSSSTMNKLAFAKAQLGNGCCC